MLYLNLTDEFATFTALGNPFGHTYFLFEFAYEPMNVSKIQQIRLDSFLFRSQGQINLSFFLFSMLFIFANLLFCH